jgi:hypothetical protein
MRCFWILLSLVAFICFQSCAHKELPENVDSKLEHWEFITNGDTAATYQMHFERKNFGASSYTISGKFSGNAHDHIGAYGTVECAFSGKTNGNNIKASFEGVGRMQMGTVKLSGSLWGYLNETEGSGEWKLSHSEGSSKGTWIMRKVN